jgi:CRP-like cAMP-binding protein
LYSDFCQYLHSFEAFSTSELATIQDALSLLEVPAQHNLVAHGQPATHIYFIRQGLVRIFYIVDGEEKTLFVAPEYHFIGSLESMVAQQPSMQYVQTLEPSVLLALPYTALLELYERVPRLNAFVRKLLEQRMIHVQQLLYTHITHTHEQRYRWLLSTQAELLQRVPLHILATFLGITPVSLSRIRRRLAERPDTDH